MKSHYDVLGIATNATQEQVVTAYRLRSKVLHPDRFDRTKQSVEWELANELLKELNASYAILRDPNSRAEYDRAIGVSQTSATARPTSSGSAASQTAARKSPPPRRVSVVPALSSGYAVYRTLSATLRSRLRNRCRGKVTPQFRVRIGGVVTAYILVAIVVCAAAVSLSSSAAERWEPDTLQGAMFWTFIGVATTAHSLFRIIRWHSSPLKRYLIVTPLYLIETRFDEVWYWPLWHVKHLSGTHRYYNSIYFGTDTFFKFENAQRSYRLRHESDYQALVEAFRAFSEKALSAEQQYDRQYFIDEDDFRAIQQPARARRYRWKLALGTTAVTAIAAVIFAVAILTINAAAPKPKPVRLGATSNIPYNAPTPVPTEPEEPPYDPSIEPANGAVFRNELWRGGHGTLTITNGTSNGAIVKLVSSRSNRSVFTVFIAPNSNYTIQNVPNGTYRLAYATGRRFNPFTDTFERLYGISVFDQSLTYDTQQRYESDGVYTDYYQFEVTLQPVVGGNARTSPLAAQSFEQF
jgi:DnaJ-like protein